MSLQGCDISHYQTVQWSQVSGVSFVYAKATDGASFTDSSFASHVKGARSQGIPVGAYHFARPGSPVQVQVDHFCSVAEGMDLRPMLDLEQTTVSPGATTAWTLDWLARVEQKLGVRPLLYTGPGFASKFTPDPRLATYDLWVAHYTTAPAPRLPAPWNKWLVWQWNSSGHVPGISGSVDLDRLDGTVDALRGQEEDMTPQELALAISDGSAVHTDVLHDALVALVRDTTLAVLRSEGVSSAASGDPAKNPSLKATLDAIAASSGAQPSVATHYALTFTPTQ